MLSNGVVAHAASLCVHPTGAWRCFTSIQEAVDAANDHTTITVWPGVYREQVFVADKNLTLIGRPGAVIQAPDEMQETLSSVAGAEGRPIILVYNTNVTIRNLTIDGQDSAEHNPFIDGIVFINSDGAIRNNVVKNIGFGEPRLPVVNGEPLYQGEGITVVNFDPAPRQVTIAENWVVDYNTVGIDVFAETDPNDLAASNLSVNVTNNIIIGWGPNDELDQWGIFFGGYNFADPQFSIAGSITGNRVRNQFTLAPYPLPGVGIATFSTANVSMTDNVIDNTNVGLAANQASGAQIMHNQISGRGSNVSGSLGFILSGENTQVIENRVKKMETGILLFVDDPAYGSALATVIHNNRLDNVSMDLMTSPGAMFMVAAKTLNSNKTNNFWKRLPVR